MGRIEDLASIYEQHISLPWQRTMGGAQRVIMLVYDKELERVLRARKSEFEQRTMKQGHGWAEFDCTQCFAQWMADDEYREAYFEFPDDLTMKIASEFACHVTNALRALLQASDEKTVIALMGAASLYGFLRISALVHAVERDIKGRLLVFFPGTKEESNYQLLDARDGWNYLAHSITLNGSGGTL